MYSIHVQLLIKHLYFAVLVFSIWVIPVVHQISLWHYTTLSNVIFISKGWTKKKKSHSYLNKQRHQKESQVTSVLILCIIGIRKVKGRLDMYRSYKKQSLYWPSLSSQILITFLPIQLHGCSPSLSLKKKKK